MLAAIVLVVAGLLGWSGTREPESAGAAPAPTEQPLSRSEVTCPAVGATKLAKSNSGLGMASRREGTSGAGTVELVEISRDRRVGKPRKLRPGRWDTARQPNLASNVAVSATGPTAAGFSAYVATDAAAKAGGGLAVTGCARPGREAWFVGAGSTVDHASTLLISNPAQTSAIVDVSLLTRKGSRQPSRTRGLVVDPNEVVRLELSGLAAGQGDVAVRVEANQGRVATAALDHWQATLDPAGTEWIPPVEAADTSITVSPMVGDAARRELIVANPGDRTASVELQVVGPQGTAAIEGFDSVTVDPGSVATTKVPGSLDQQAGALRIDSDQPVVAAVRSVSKGSPADVAYGTGAPTFSSAAVVPVDLPTMDPSRMSLAMTGAKADREAAVSVAAYSADGRQLSQGPVRIPAGSTVEWRADRRRDLGTRLRRVSYLVVTPTSGAVHASAIYAPDDSGLAAFPLAAAPTTVQAPGVYPIE